MQNMQKTEENGAAELIASFVINRRETIPQAKRRYLKAAGRDARLPENFRIESFIRAHYALANAQLHKKLLAALRAEAIAIMFELENAGIPVWITGPVLNGAATEESPIRLETFAHSGKDIGIALLNRGIEWKNADPAASPEKRKKETLFWIRPFRRNSVLAELMPFSCGTEVLLDVLPPGSRGKNPEKRKPDPYQTELEASGRAGIEDLRKILRESTRSDYPD